MSKTERIKKILSWLIYKGYATNNMEIALKLGYNKSSFSQIINGKVPLSDRFIEKLVSVNANINKLWIATGEGKMILTDPQAPYSYGKSTKNDLADEVITIPLLPISAQGGSLNEFFVSVKGSDCERIISPIKGAEFAITVSGESMSPEYPSGAKILIKKINEKAFIEWGEVYVLDTCNGTVLKTLQDPKKEGCVLCTSINPDPKFAPFLVNTEDILGVYRVMMCMTVK